MFFTVYYYLGPNPLGITQSPNKTVGWDYNTRLALERFIEVSRVLFVIFAIAFHTYLYTPPVTITPTRSLALNSSIGICQHPVLYQLKQLVPNLAPQCNPYFTSLQYDKSNKSIELVSYAGYKLSANSSTTTNVWQKTLSTKAPPIS